MAPIPECFFSSALTVSSLLPPSPNKYTKKITRRWWGYTNGARLDQHAFPLDGWVRWTPRQDDQKQVVEVDILFRRGRESPAVSKWRTVIVARRDHESSLGF